MSSITVLVVSVSIFIVFCLIYETEKGVGVAKQLKREGFTISAILSGIYVGYIPSFTLSDVETVHIFLDNDKGNILIVNSKDEREIIPYQKVKSVTKETKESLTVARILFTGLVAFALKEKTHYFRICYTNDIGDESNVVFESHHAHDYVQKILNNRYNYLKPPMPSQEPVKETEKPSYAIPKSHHCIALGIFIIILIVMHYIGS